MYVYIIIFFPLLNLPTTHPPPSPRARLVPSPPPPFPEVSQLSPGSFPSLLVAGSQGEHRQNMFVF